MSRNKETDRKYQLENKDKIKEANKKYRDANKNKIKERNKKYQLENKDEIREKKRIYQQKRIKSNPLVKLRYRISNNISVSFSRNNNKKPNKTTKILGCSYEEFKTHIESLWESWMNWDNYGNPKDGIYEINKTWDLDHVIPISSATCEKDIIKLNHYSNFKPLCSYNNRFIKKDTI